MIVVKLGGAALQHSLQDDKLFQSLLQAYSKPIIVHGGGPEISKMAEILEVKSDFFEGQRITTPKLLEVVELVLKGKINPQIVRSLQKNKRSALGLSGTDLSLLKCREEKPELGLVGRVTECRSDLLIKFVDENIIPVIAPIGYLNHQACNINADWAASAVAQATQAEELIFLTDSPGVLDENQELIETMTLEECRQLLRNGVAVGGMLVKCEATIEFLEKTEKARVRIAGGQSIDEIIRVFEDSTYGTTVSA